MEGGRVKDGRERIRLLVGGRVDEWQRIISMGTVAQLVRSLFRLTEVSLAAAEDLVAHHLRPQ